jgi:hypothetical protein
MAAQRITASPVVAGSRQTLATVCALFVLYLGLSFILAPEASTQGVGLPTWPAGNGDGFLIMKGTREFSMGLVIGILLLTSHRRALSWVLLVEAVAPVRRHDQRLGPPRLPRCRVRHPRPDLGADRDHRPADPPGDQ